jgi:hypothetical protein
VSAYPELTAGPYGIVGKCDIPVAALDRMTVKINEIAPDILFWTGDIVPHDMWQQSQAHAEKYSDFLTNYMNENLKYATYAIDGNHDFGSLLNSQSFESTDPMLIHQAETWKHWMTDDALAQFKRHGFYTQRLKTTAGKEYDKAWVIAVNTQACYYWNFFLMS